MTLDIEINTYRRTGFVPTSQPIGLKESSIDQTKVMNRISAVYPHRGSFIGETTKFNVTRSNYGAKLALMNTTTIHAASSFANISGWFILM